MPRMVTVLEDCARYRDGKKWKRRYCFLCKHDNKKTSVTMFLTKHFGTSAFNPEMDDKLASQYLIDDITGFEHGRHVDKECHVVALIGQSVVYCIAFDHTESMFRWAETLTKLLTSTNHSVHFHVTLKKVSETNGIFNKISVGTQGNLHVQSNRLCLIGEPADGNKFICDWRMVNLISVDMYDTVCDKAKKLIIRSGGGKANKGKGHFEFEIGLTQQALFEDTFSNFISACKASNPEFTSNFLVGPEPSEIGTDSDFSYSITCLNRHGSNSDNSSSVEKRSSEIPIPRSREHSGPHQRNIDNLQLKTRKSSNNVRNGSPEYYSATETMGQHDNEAYIFANDEDEIEDPQGNHKVEDPFCNGLSQESSGVYVTGASGSIKDTDFSLHTSAQDDSGCGNLSPNPLRSTLNRSDSHKTNLFLTFYRNLNQNPLSLTNYSNYYRLLHRVLNKGTHFMTRSNSFNCGSFPVVKTLEYRRKFSNTNFPLNLPSKEFEKHFKTWKEKINRTSIEDALYLEVDKDNVRIDEARLLLSNRLPFRCMKDFHGCMMRSLHSGTVCFNMFCYHHFLSLLSDVKSVIKKIEDKFTPNEAGVEYSHLKDLICRKSKVYNHWLERIQSYSRPCDSDQIDPSILDINILLVFEIMDTVLNTRSGSNYDLCDIVLRQQKLTSINNPTIELTETNQQPYTPDISVHNSLYLDCRPLLSTSCSTPDFRHYSPQKRDHKLLGNNATQYQNLSDHGNFDTINHTFPKQNMSLNKPVSSANKEGTFRRFRRKYSPNSFIPFIRRKTSSMHSTVSEPICQDNEIKDQNSYYNIANQMESIIKNPHLVTYDSNYYTNMRQDPNYVNITTNSAMLASIDSSLYDDNTPYPDEIEDPSRNYGDLNDIKSRLQYSHHDPDSASALNFRRSNLSILSHKSLQTYGTMRSVSVNKCCGTKLSRVHSDACNHHREYSTDYINVSPSSLSPLSLPSCCAQIPPLNYVTVNENSICNDFCLKSSTKPLTISTESEAHVPSTQWSSHALKPRQSWFSAQILSPNIDYCQIDMRCTYALRDIDQKLKSRETKTITPSGRGGARHGSSDHILSYKSLEQMTKSQKRCKTYFNRLFARRCDSTN